MRDEYEFGGGVRGKYVDRYQADAPVRILDGDDPDTETDCVVSLDPDVRAAFPDSKSVNEALRLLIKAAREAQELRRAG